MPFYQARAMEANRDDRYPSARALADDLTRFLDGKPVTARPPGCVQRLIKWTRRHRPIVLTASATLLLSLLVGMLLLSNAYEAEQTQRAVADAALQKSAQLYEQLLTESPDQIEFRETLVTTYRRLAEVYAAMSKPDQADTAYARGWEHITELGDREFATQELRRTRAQYVLGRAQIRALRGDWSQAELHGSQAYDEFKTLAMHPAELSEQLLLAKAGHVLARSLRCQGKHAAAQEVGREAVKRARDMRRFHWSDSRDLRKIESELHAELGELSLATKDAPLAERHFREALELKRTMLKTGHDPVGFYASFLSTTDFSLAAHNELEPFCDHAVVQLRLARALVEQKRPYAAELALSECMVAMEVISETQPESLRYRVVRANAWAMLAALLEQRRPDEAQLPQQWSTAIWQDTMKRFLDADRYRSGVHDPQTDLAWFREQFPGLLASTTIELEVYSPNDQFVGHPLWGTPFYQHALGMAYCKVGAWSAAKPHFESAAKLRTSGQAFDWLRLAMVCTHLNERESARQWLDKTASVAETDAELEQLKQDARELIGSTGND